MTTDNQQLLATLKRHPVKIPQWKKAPNEWVTKLPNATVGKIGERFVEIALGATKAPKGSSFDLVYECATTLKAERLEVKLCRKSFSATNVWGWKQIRPQDSWDWLCLIAIEPADTFLFVVPKSIILMPGRLSNQHGKKNTGQNFMQLTFQTFPKWLTPYEIR